MAAEPWTLTQAQEHLANWLQAEADVATGQSYTIGDRMLTRAHLSEIRQQITFWRNEITRLQSGRGAGARVLRIIPRDL